MNNNDILRRVRYIFNYNDTKMMELFSLAGYNVTRAQLSEWLKPDDNPECKVITDYQLALFLDGFIVEKRGRKDGEQAPAEKKLTNNIVFRKLKIALALKDDDIIAILDLVDFRMGKTELSAFFRNPGQNQYRPCKDQILRNFMGGLQAKYRPAE